MTIVVLDAIRRIGLVHQLSSSLRKATPDQPSEWVERRQLKEIERLALLSPHLLADLGFGIDAQASNRTTVVWRNGSICVWVISETAGTAVKASYCRRER